MNKHVIFDSLFLASTILILFVTLIGNMNIQANNFQIDQTATITTRSTFFTPNASVKVFADKLVYTLGDTVMVAAEGTQVVPSWIFTTWEYLPAEVEIRDPTNVTVQVTSLGVYRSGSYTTWTPLYTIASTATTGEYVIWIRMTPGYGARFYVVEEKVMVDGSTSTTATITETETWFVALSSTKVTVIDEFPFFQLILGMALIVSIVGFKTSKAQSH